jgi:hypothetical protein
MPRDEKPPFLHGGFSLGRPIASMSYIGHDWGGLDASHAD